MTKTPAVRLLVAGILLFLGSVAPVRAQGARYAPGDMLDPRLAPKFDDVPVSTPSAEELKSCTVVNVPGTTPTTGGFMLLDANKKPLRRFYVSKDRGKVDLWSYYKDGVEIYREMDTTGAGSPNSFRWLNAGGMKWGVGGVDAKGRAHITAWQMISAEEVAFEAFQAVAKNDFARLQALFITPADMQRIKLPAAEVQRINELQAQASKKFSDLAKAANFAAAKFEVVEGAVPSCDTTGDVETIRHANRAIRYELKGEHKWLHSREMIRVGIAWRLVEAPSDKDGVPGVGAAAQATGNPQLEKLLSQLAEVDANTPASAGPLAKDQRVHGYYQKRIALLQQIVTLDKQDQSEGWYKQIFDNLAAAAQNSGDDAMLKQMKDNVVRQMPGSNLAGYAVYREASTRYVKGMAEAGSNNKLIGAAQDKWLDDLSEFVKKFSKAEDTPEALHYLAIGCEYAGKIEEAKRWYTQLSASFPQHHLTPRARGSVDRLNLVGAPMRLTAARLDNGQAFDIGQLKGSKFVIVHYWRSQNNDLYKDDFARLKVKLASSKDVELVSINLDDDAATARKAIAAIQAPGIHLYQAPTGNTGGGLNNPLATQYGIHVLPTLFLVNRDGRVTNNALQVGDIDSELRKVQ